MLIVRMPDPRSEGVGSCRLKSAATKTLILLANSGVVAHVLCGVQVVAQTLP